MNFGYVNNLNCAETHLSKLLYASPARFKTEATRGSDSQIPRCLIRPIAVFSITG